MNHQTATTTGQETFCLVCSSRHHDAPNCSFVERTNKPKPQTKNPKPSKPKTMHKFTLINWSQWSRASQQFSPCDSMQEAMADANHETPYGAEAMVFEQYTQVIETNDHDEIVNDYYFVTL